MQLCASSELCLCPDKALAAREAYRVLKRDGLFLFNVWDAMRHNKLGELAHRTIVSYFEKDPPTFYKVPFSYHNRAEIRQILKQAGFREIKTEVIAKIGKANRAEDVARGLVEGNPVAVTIAKRDPSLLPIITSAVTAAITRRFGERDIRAPMRAIVVRASRLTDRDADRGAFCLVHASAIVPQTATGR